ncbi:glycoside hydrolase family 32 protein [Paenibacillus kandeliae]|uniref:glycoside hydrolase family 32 protein n=1 Tax=Paenibacillus kandeliae TaxID=3231269 RepID=UPI003457CF6B
MSNYRLDYHIAPTFGFMNDPNGLVQFNGKYHVFYQWLDQLQAQGPKSWGHVASHDLVHWETYECALQPDQWYDKDGCYSGSAIVHEDTLYLFYTGNVRTESGDRETYQCLATSTDGEQFTKHGPIIHLPEGYTPHFRDPKVWKDRAAQQWWMVIGAQTQALTGNVALYRSDDLWNWTYQGNMLPDTRNWGYMCECPDLVTVADQQYMIVSRQEKIQRDGRELDQCIPYYFAGQMQPDAQFLLYSGQEQQLDEGWDYYAPQSFVDEQGRVLSFAWMGGGEIDYQMAQPTVPDGWLHALTIPRELIAGPGGMKQRPVAELQKLRQHERSYHLALAGHEDVSETVLPVTSHVQEMWLAFGDVQHWQLLLLDGVQLHYSAESGQAILKRRNWWTGQWDERVLVLPNGLQQLHVFIDRSSVELFINDGEKTATMRVFFDSAADTIRLSGCTNVNVKVWELSKEEL